MISVIGAGPSGCISAISCSKCDEVRIFEEHKKQPVQCAGLISKSGIERLGIPLEKIARNRIRGARIFSPSGNLLEIDGKETKAYVFDRSEFDEELLNIALDSGVEFVNKRVKNISEMRDSERIIIATGTDYKLHRKLGLDIPRKFLVCAQYEMKLESDPDFVELHFNVPGFFSWIIPLEDYARIGVCARKDPVSYLDSFVKRLKKNGRILNSKIMDKNFGTIPVYNPGLKTEYGRLITVGDAAGQVKATTGGGVVMGGISAGFSCEKDYERRWRNEIGRELYIHLLIRRFLDRLSDKSLDSLFSLLEENKEIIVQRGDMDMASGLLLGFAKNPRFLAGLITRTPGYILDMVI